MGFGNESIEEQLQKKIDIPYNHFIKNLSSCDWSMIVPNKRYQMLEKNRSNFVGSTPIKETFAVLKWIEHIKAFCPLIVPLNSPNEIKNEILTGICPEAIYVICKRDFLKNSYNGIITKKYEFRYGDNHNKNFDKSIKLEYEKKNEEIDYSVIEHDQKYYFITMISFKIIDFKEIILNPKKIEIYTNFLEKNTYSSDLEDFVRFLCHLN